MLRRLQIPLLRDRMLVRAADAALAPIGWWRSRRTAGPIRRVLLMRLERIGDLLMVLDAIDDARRAWPEAEIDLAVGSWNAPLAKLIPGVTRLELADVPWLAREGRGDSWASLVSRARGWRRRGYDLVVNFEPDIRSNALARLTGASRRVGYWTGGGGAFLTDALEYAPTSHVLVNARALIAHAAGGSSKMPPMALTTTALLTPPADADARAAALLGNARRPLVGVHASGGRESKQWHVSRFAAVARALAEEHHATIVLTGAVGDRRLVDQLKHALSDVAVIDACGDLDLPTLAAVLARLDLFVTGDTGPMHLAAAMATPVVALFGPADPRRYGPLVAHQRVVRVTLYCSPCGLVRLPPIRCRGHVPDCMDSIEVDTVVSAATDLLATARPRH